MISRRICFRGTARIPTRCLSVAKSRLLEDRVSDRESTYDGNKHISVLVGFEQLQEALKEAGLEADALLKLPNYGHPLELRTFGTASLHVLQGYDQILTERCTPIGDINWRDVRLYVEEHGQNPKNASTGEIFRMLRICQIHGQPNEEQRWWKCISDSITKDVKQLLSNNVIMKEIDRSLSTSAFWLPIKLGAFRRLHGVKCEEEIAHYINHINTTWDPIFQCLGKDVWAVDDATIEYLQLRAPKASSQDRKEIVAGMKSGLLFPYFKDQQIRSQLVTCLLDIPGLIPSVQTMFNNLIYIEPCATVLKGLLNPRPKASIKTSFSAAFQSHSESHVEEAHGIFRQCRAPKSDKAFEFSYIQLWLYAMRNFPEMTRITVKKEAIEPRHYANEPSAQLWHDFAKLAARLGFNTPRVGEILSTNPSMAYAQRTLLNACPPEKYYFDDGKLETYVRQISRMIDSAKRLPSPPSQSQVIQMHTEPRNRRCGRPYEHSHIADKDLLFLPTIHNFPEHTGPVSSLFVKKDFLTSFFGRDWIGPWHSSSQQARNRPLIGSKSELPLDAMQKKQAKLRNKHKEPCHLTNRNSSLLKKKCQWSKRGSTDLAHIQGRKKWAKKRKIMQGHCVSRAF